MSPQDNKVKEAEEARRDRNLTPRERWAQILAAIEFAESNMQPAQRRNRPRWAKYSRPLPVEA
ncbi:MAG: hypothetical protein PHD76_07935 [Methylacidiphilales bacterium]|nr:hypothetical protein [Candidatus Methylacidiphilales bacterium]